jgi:hypothetical protein
MRSVLAMGLGLLLTGVGIVGAAVVTPLAVPQAFAPDGSTVHVVALAIMLAITEVFALFAGWVTARLASDHRIGHAALMATCALAIAIAVGAIRWSTAPAWYHVTSWVLLIPAAVLGARAWVRVVQRKASAGARSLAAT